MTARAGTTSARKRGGKVVALRPEVPAQPAAPAASLAKAPAWLSKDAAAIWPTIVGRLEEALPEGALNDLHTPALALMLEHYVIATEAAKSMRSGRGGKAVALVPDPAHGDRVGRRHPAALIMRDHGKAFLELAREFAMTPRTAALLDMDKLGGLVPDDDDDDLFDS